MRRPANANSALRGGECHPDALQATAEAEGLGVGHRQAFPPPESADPSRRRLRNASAALKHFVPRPKKTFSTLSALSRLRHSVERPLFPASSTDRCNTFCELLSRCLIEQGLSRPFIELPCDSTELGLAVQGQLGHTRKILAQQSVGVFVDPRCQGDRGSQK